ncbi:WD40/YVTN/BNR-like repeat-containing protein [Sandaracinus amylolyticus]|uniref:Glycosyl hydrolase, BNR repeat n=1 Tax=Sandaracinus amylolyticus TaxID=927083 RepID=A0A0F6SEA6_9BACT|nr:sialidase family protein [Sandaracinus amylolyticus]AKF04859.1 Glycosyl hydrolase, BNR repeat precursor [Sandaracinus amylolyticus]
MMMRVSSIALLLVLALAARASAHGREPSLGAVTFHPTDRDHVVVRATWGFITTRDGGETWTWQCADAVPFDRTNEDPAIVMFPSRALVAATFDGLHRSDEAQCAWSTPETAPDDEYVVDVVQDPSEPRTAWLITSTGTTPDEVRRSEDEGLTWSTIAIPHPTALTDRIRVGTSDPMRVYTSGAILMTDTEPRRGVVLRSDDRAETFRAIEIPLVEGERIVHVLGVDPTNADRLFARMVRPVADEVPERLLISEDGGDTWRTVLEMLEIVGFAMSADGRTVWAGSWDGGLARSTDGGLTFEMLDPALRVRCLAQREGELWVCADDRTTGFALARSSDGGETLDALWSYDDVRNDVGCSADTQVGERCPMFWPDLVFDLQVDAGIVPDAGVTTMDAGSGEGGGDGGCSCRAGPSTRAPGGALLLGLALLALRRARRV